MARPKQKLMDETHTKRANPTFTPERKLKFLEAYARCGHKTRASANVGVHVTTVCDHEAKDPLFKAAVAEALDLYVGSLQEIATDRFRDGVQRPLIGGRNKDEIIAYEQVFDNRLGEFLMKTYSRQHALGAGNDEGGPAGVGGAYGGGVLIVPNRVQSVEDWERVYGDAARGTGGAEGGA